MSCQLFLLPCLPADILPCQGDDRHLAQGPEAKNTPPSISCLGRSAFFFFNNRRITNTEPFLVGSKGKDDALIVLSLLLAMEFGIEWVLNTISVLTGTHWDSFCLLWASEAQAHE